MMPMTPPRSAMRRSAASSRLRHRGPSAATPVWEQKMRAWSLPQQRGEETGRGVRHVHRQALARHRLEHLRSEEGEPEPAAEREGGAAELVGDQVGEAHERARPAGRARPPAPPGPRSPGRPRRRARRPASGRARRRPASPESGRAPRRRTRRPRASRSSWNSVRVHGLRTAASGQPCASAKAGKSADEREPSRDDGEDLEPDARLARGGRSRRAPGAAGPGGRGSRAGVGVGVGDVRLPMQRACFLLEGSAPIQHAEATPEGTARHPALDSGACPRRLHRCA